MITDDKYSTYEYWEYKNPLKFIFAKHAGLIIDSMVKDSVYVSFNMDNAFKNWSTIISDIKQTKIYRTYKLFRNTINESFSDPMQYACIHEWICNVNYLIGEYCLSNNREYCHYSYSTETKLSNSNSLDFNRPFLNKMLKPACEFTAFYGYKQRTHAIVIPLNSADEEELLLIENLRIKIESETFGKKYIDGSTMSFNISFSRLFDLETISEHERKLPNFKVGKVDHKRINQVLLLSGDKFLENIYNSNLLE